MNTEELNHQIEQAPIGPEENPLLFWAAYMDGTDGKKHYLGNGKGGVRLFKLKDGEDGIEAFLDKVVSAKHRANVHVHQVQGNIVVPVDDPDIEPARPKLSRLPHLFEGLPIPISTTYPNSSPPNALDLMHDIEQRQKRKRKRK